MHLEIFLVINYLLCVQEVGHGELSDSETVVQEQKEKIVIELYLITDLEFSRELFFDATAVQSYWETVFFNVHLHYQTLIGIDVSFNWVGISMITNSITFTQTIHEQYPLPNGNINNLHTMEMLQWWLFSRSGSLPKFDIAAYTIAGPWNTNASGFTMQWGACSEKVRDPPKQPKIQSAVVIRTDYDTPLTLSHEIAHLLGAEHDNSKSFEKNSCENYSNSTRHMMHYRNAITTDRFSACSNFQILQYLQTPGSACLKTLQHKDKPIFSTQQFSSFGGAVDTWRGVSVIDQCRVIYGRSGSERHVLQDECTVSHCVINGEQEEPNYKSFIPLDGTQCGDRNTRQFCVRRKCRRPGVHIISARTKYCLYKGTGNEAKLKNCTEMNISPYEMFYMIEENLVGMAVVTLDYDKEKNNYYLACLTILKNTENQVGRAVFLNCKNTEHFEWEIKKLEFSQPITKERNFMLFHVPTSTCLSTSNNIESLMTSSTCNYAYSKDALSWNIVLENGSFVNYDELNQFVEKQNTLILFFCLLVVLVFLLYRIFLYMKWACYKLAGKLKCVEQLSSDFQVNPDALHDVVIGEI